MTRKKDDDFIMAAVGIGIALVIVGGTVVLTALLGWLGFGISVFVSGVCLIQMAYDEDTKE